MADPPKKSDADTVVDQTIVEGSTLDVPDETLARVEHTIFVPDEDEPAPKRVPTIVVPDGAAETRALKKRPVEKKKPAEVPVEKKPRISAGILVPLAVISLVLVVASIVGIVLIFGGDHEAEPTAPAPLAIGRCEGEPPSAVVLARVRPGEPVPAADSFGALGSAIEVHRQLANDAVASVTFELSRTSFPEWDALAQGAAREAICQRIARAIVERSGRDARTLEFFDARDTSLRDEVVGMLSSRETRPAILDSLEPLSAEADCSYYGIMWASSVRVTCEVTNIRTETARIRIAPVLFRGRTRVPYDGETVVLSPRQHAIRRFELRSQGERCGCEVSTVP